MTSNPTVVITGASSGIGAAIAKKFSHEGWNLILFGRDKQRLANVAKDCSSTKVETLAFDLNDYSQNKSEIIHLFSKAQNLKALINNAGVFKTGHFVDTPITNWIEHFQTNLFSAVQITQAIWPFFLKQNTGSIVNIASTLGIKPTATTGAYSASKAAMINWTLSLAQDGGTNNIRANCICPGIVDTPLHSFHNLQANAKNEVENQMTKLQLLNFIGQPAYIADATYFLASDNSKWTTGATLNVDGGINIK